MRVTLANGMWCFLLAGFALALLCSANASTSGATLILCAFVGAAIAFDDFSINTKIKANVGAGNMGGDSDGI